MWRQGDGMSNEIVVIGSGFAAQQLIKCLRRLDVEQPIRLITADAGDEYNKPDLSHVVSRQSSARSMIRQPGADFAEQQRITLHSECPVLSIDRQRQIVVTSAGEFAYGQLVLATGATAMRPDFPGAEFLVSLNSLQEYAGIEERLRQASRIMILGAGLIGCELAMDMASDNRQVTLVDLADAPLSALLPEFLSQPLHQALRQQGIELLLGQAIAEIAPHPSENSPSRVQVTLSSGTQREPDLVLVAIGLRANTMLATDAGLAVGRGIRVDECLRTSDPAIFALGDCAEWQERLLPFLQPIALGANALAKTLLGCPTPLVLPPLLVKIKTPLYPMQLAGRTRGEDLHWQCRWHQLGLVAEARELGGRLSGFVVGGDQMASAFPLLRELVH